MYKAENEYQEIEEAAFENPQLIANILRKLDNCEKSFNEGDRSALFKVLRLCAIYQAVIPTWAANAILQGNSDLNSGRLKDINSLFGWEAASKHQTRNRKRNAEINENTAEVVAMLINHRCDGGNLSSEEAFGLITDNTGIPRRIVEDIYRANKHVIKSIPIGNPSNENHATCFMQAPIFRRYGRKIL